MKTDVVEIFQTVRASIQPYAALGFDAEENTETSYRLTTFKGSEENPEKTIFFASAAINGNAVDFCIFPKDSKMFDRTLSKHELKDGCFSIQTLDNTQVAEIENALSEGYRIYKEKGWV